MNAALTHRPLTEGHDLIVKRFVLGLALAAIVSTACVRAWPAAGQNHSPATLEGTLRELDRSAKGFHSLSADVERTKVTVVVNDRSTETGTILVHDDKMLLEMKPPDARTILRTGDNLYIYNPGLKRVEEYNLAQHRAQVDQYLLLGFGMQGKELQKSYLVTLLGEPTLDDKKTVELELTPEVTGSPQSNFQDSDLVRRDFMASGATAIQRDWFRGLLRHPLFQTRP